jgi:hypothetical protein
MYYGADFSEFIPGGRIYAARGRQCSVGTRSAGQGVYVEMYMRGVQNSFSVHVLYTTRFFI